MRPLHRAEPRRLRCVPCNLRTTRRGRICVSEGDRTVMRRARYLIGGLLMRTNAVIACSAMIVALATAREAAAQNKPAAPSAPHAAAANAAAPAVAPQADRLIKEMSAYLGSANEFTFHADVTFDHV